MNKAYMPRLRRGGMVVPTSEPYRMGDAIYLLLALPFHIERFSVDGEMVWIAPG